LFYIRLGIVFVLIFFLLDGLSILFANKGLSIFTGLLLVPSTILMIIGVNYTMKESIYSKSLFVIFGLSTIFIYLGTQPGAVGIGLDWGYPRVEWRGLFNIMGMLFTVIMGLNIFYWGIRTWKNVPLLIKKEAFLFLLGILFLFPIGVIFYIFYLIEPIFILFSTFCTIFGALLMIFSAVREPKLLYILPFTIYRIVVKDREGHPLYDHDWSESNISEEIFTGFLNAVQLMSEEVMHMGGLLDINLEEGILILKESERITVGLVASKSSKLLRDSVVKFTDDFENRFNRELKMSIKDMTTYEPAYELIEKYFSNFPYKILKNKKQPLLLTGKYLEIPPELDNKLRSIFTDEKEYEAIKADLIKSPLSMPSAFLSSYSEMKKELKQISEEDLKLLESNSNLEE
jgi:hypothetical protein